MYDTGEALKKQIKIKWNQLFLINISYKCESHAPKFSKQVAPTLGQKFNYLCPEKVTGKYEGQTMNKWLTKWTQRGFLWASLPHIRDQSPSLICGERGMRGEFWGGFTWFCHGEHRKGQSSITEMKEGTVEIWVFHLSHLHFPLPPPSLLRSLGNLATQITVL